MDTGKTLPTNWKQCGWWTLTFNSGQGTIISSQSVHGWQKMSISKHSSQQRSMNSVWHDILQRCLSRKSNAVSRLQGLVPKEQNAKMATVLRIKDFIQHTSTSTKTEGYSENGSDNGISIIVALQRRCLGATAQIVKQIKGQLYGDTGDWLSWKHRVVISLSGRQVSRSLRGGINHKVIDNVVGVDTIE